jgi:branched-chain amino acid transport system permease protein
VGALVALPALRLTGLYLALATLAFAVFCDNMVFRQKAVLGEATVPVGRLDLPGVSFDGDRAYFVLLAAVFAAVGIGITTIRRGSLGRRLFAMKDSPAACTTLGLDLTRTKLQVFALSAAIAGLGGALYGGLQTVVGATDFAAVQSLPVLLLVVVGGITYVSGALVGGLSLALLAILSHRWGPEAARWLALGPGLVGISLGRNPNGAVHDVVSRLRAGRRGAAEGESIGGPAALDALGFTDPLGPEDVAVLDRALAIDEVFCDVPA